MRHLKENGMDSRILALASLFAFGVCAAHAGEPVYKSTMPDGRIIYGESPQPGAKRVAKVAAPLSASYLPRSGRRPDLRPKVKCRIPEISFLLGVIDVAVGHEKRVSFD
jgi:hypothetical protein